MARRGLPFGIAFMLVAGLGMTGETPGGPSSVLVWFDFDGDEVETGPYTLIAYEHARGSVSLTSLYRHSGSRSVEIRDVAGDGAFTELQGFFREMPAGKVYVHFAFLMAEPAESMNIALAGAGHFAMVEHGFGLWLKAKGGTLYHVTAGRERPLFPIRAFTWYVSDLAYDVDRGRYDLTITPERSRQPIVALRGVANPTGRAGSRIHKFSFIGDPPGVDRSNARFYVDDIIVRADHPVPDEGPLVAPGRRMLFVDIHRYYRSLLYDKPGCLPALGPEDFALSSLDLQTLAAAGQLKLYDDLADRRSPALPKDLTELVAPKLKAMAEWGQGCAAGCGGECALRFFEGAQAAVPEAKLFAMSRVLALAGQKRWKQADELFIAGGSETLEASR